MTNFKSGFDSFFSFASAISQVFLPVCSSSEFQINASRVFRDDVGRVRWIIDDNGQWFGLTYRLLDKNWQVESLIESWRIWRTADNYLFRAFEVSGLSALGGNECHLYFRGTIFVEQHSGKIKLQVDSSGYEYSESSENEPVESSGYEHSC